MKAFVSSCVIVMCGIVLWAPVARAATGQFELEITPLECTTDTVYDGLQQLQYAYPAECTRVIKLTTAPYTLPAEASGITGTFQTVPVASNVPGAVLSADVFPHIRALSVMDAGRPKEPVMALSTPATPPEVDHPGGGVSSSNRLTVMLAVLASILLAAIIRCVKKAWR